MNVRPFHIAFPVHDIKAAREFYAGRLGCEEGRSSDYWVDFNLYGHQIVAHLDRSAKSISSYNDIDDHAVPVPHFGVIMEMADWEVLADRLKKAGQKFLIEPYVRFKGQKGEQATMSFLDPSGNALEFKAFADDSMIFER